MKTLEGKLVAGNEGKDMRIGIVASRFNEFITTKLLGGATDALLRHGVKDDDITVAWVPGAFEIPLIAEKMAQSKKYDAVICVGAVIRGNTSHYDYVCSRECILTERGASSVRCADHGKYRADDRACRNQSRKQGI